LLKENPTLSQDIEGFLATDAEMVKKVVNITQNVKGDKNIVIGEASGTINFNTKDD
jgi:hypothetical protein